MYTRNSLFCRIVLPCSFSLLRLFSGWIDAYLIFFVNHMPFVFAVDFFSKPFKLNFDP